MPWHLAVTTELGREDFVNRTIRQLTGIQLSKIVGPGRIGISLVKDDSDMIVWMQQLLRCLPDVTEVCNQNPLKS